MDADDLVSLNLAIAADEQRYAACPLEYERAAGWHIEDYWRVVERGLNTYLHGANSSAKSRGGGAFDLAKCMGLDRLLARDGSAIPLTVLKPPVTWGLGVQSYKLADPGPLAALRTLLGSWDYREDAQDHTFTIRHKDAASEREWSKLYVYPYDGPNPEGPRLDGVRMDEPPPLKFLDAMQSRYKLGRVLYQSITATPIDRRTWYPILEQYPRALREESEGRYRIQAALWDNELIPAWQIEQILARWRWNEPSMRKIARARILGEHVDDSGSAPWRHSEVLERWLERARRTKPTLIPLTVQMDREEVGQRRLVPIRCTIRQYGVYEPGDVCIVISDHGKGVRDGKHDPDAIHVYSMRRRKLMAVVSETLGGWGSGLAAVELSRMYGNAVWWPLVTGGYAEAALSAASRAGFARIGHREVNTRPGVQDVALGVNETVRVRNESIGAIEQAMATDSVLIEDEEVLQTLADCVIDANGKIVGGPESGWHDEHLVCAGQGCWRLGNRKVQPVQRANAEERRAVIERALNGGQRAARRPMVPAMRW